MSWFGEKRETHLPGEQTGKSLLEFINANPGATLGHEAQIKVLRRLVEADEEINQLKTRISVMEQSRV